MRCSPDGASRRPAILRIDLRCEWPRKAAIEIDLNQQFEEFCAFRWTIGGNNADLRHVGKSGSALSTRTPDCAVRRARFGKIPVTRGKRY
jgi:hypothetical protein